MTALQWIGLVWAPLTLWGIAPALRTRARIAEIGYLRTCRGCQARRDAYWQTERAWRYWYGVAGLPLMILAAATVWWAAPFLPALRRLAGLPDLPQCAGPSCAAHKRYIPAQARRR